MLFTFYVSWNKIKINNIFYANFKFEGYVCVQQTYFNIFNGIKLKLNVCLFVWCCVNLLWEIFFWSINDTNKIFVLVWVAIYKF